MENYTNRYTLIYFHCLLKSKCIILQNEIYVYLRVYQVVYWKRIQFCVPDYKVYQLCTNKLFLYTSDLMKVQPWTDCQVRPFFFYRNIVVDDWYHMEKYRWKNTASNALTDALHISLVVSECHY